ncbi:MAG: Eco57I restriction-modification methylase domain-containing protein, partial [bacterium]
LGLTPQISADGAHFSFAEFAGNARKTSGSYYTPDSLVQCLLDSALDPVVEEAIKGKTGAEAEKAILALKVCDPAVGSGHFLVGAAHRLARHLARVRALAQGESEPSPLLYQHALRDVIGRCLYGVDVNPMASELCRVSLWLEALEPGKPLSFLDHHIRVGNSLLGTTPTLIAAGLPDDAFTAIEGDDKRACTALKKRNKQEREGQMDMLHLMVAEPEAEYNSIAARTRGLDDAPDDTIGDVLRKAEQFQELVVSPEYQHRQQVADAWCAAFVWIKQERAPIPPLTTDTILRLKTDSKALSSTQHSEVERLSNQTQFFHWYLAFPEVFVNGGFDSVLGNPPWERIKLQEKEWFANRSPEIADAGTANDRRARIAALKSAGDLLYLEFAQAIRAADAEAHLIRDTGRFPLSSHGDINTYSIFTELGLSLVSPMGRMGIICPSGIATDSSNETLFGFLMAKSRLISLFDFQNSEGLFPTVYWRMKFCLLTAAGAQYTERSAQFIFYATDVADIGDQSRRYELTAEDLRSLNPRTQTCPILRTSRDRSLLIKLYKSGGLVIPLRPTEEDWSLQLYRMFGTSSHSDLFLDAGAEVFRDASPTWDGQLVSVKGRFLKLYEGKMFNLYSHRFAHSVTTENVLRPGQPEIIADGLHQECLLTAKSRQWIAAGEYTQMTGDFLRNTWFVAFKKITSPLNERTVLAAVIPGLPTNDSVHLVLPKTNSSLQLMPCFLANICGFPLDYAARCKLGGNNLNFYVFDALPAIEAQTYSALAAWHRGLRVVEWITPRVLELSYTAWDLESFAQDCGWSGPPFRWDEERRFLLRCELDAAFFHLYLPAEANGDWRRARGETAEDLARIKASFPTPRDAVAYIMDTFPIVRRKDEEKYEGDYRTKRVILEIYDALQVSSRTGQPYKTRLDPPPADPRVSHAPRPLERPGVPASVRPRLVALEESRVLRRVTSSRHERYRTCIPRLDLKAAAGQFSDEQRPEFEEWVEVNTSRPLRKGMFVAQVVGRSMEPLIPDGAYCLFQFKTPQVRYGMVALFQLHNLADPESGGRFTVKRLSMSTQTAAGEMQRVATLVPENRDYTRIPVEDDDVKMVAEFLEVLGPLGEQRSPEGFED